MVDRVKMDMNKIAFIICCNDEPALEECLLYINDLRIPEQFQTEILVIREAHPQHIFLFLHSYLKISGTAPEKTPHNF